MNSSSSSSNNEYLFWKVYRNKYLINKIFNHIQLDEWVIYNDNKQLHINNRLKFKEINSLNWMLKNKQYKLLNYKLDNNEPIYINQVSINTLFNQLSIYSICDDKIILKESLIKLLNKKRSEFEIIDLTLEAVKCSSIEVYKILINESPYSIITYPSILEYAIQNSHPFIVEEMLLSNRFEFKKDSFLELSRKNIRYKLVMMYLILIFNECHGRERSNENENDNQEGTRKYLKFTPQQAKYSLERILKFKKQSNDKEFDIINQSYEFTLSFYQILLYIGNIFSYTNIDTNQDNGSGSTTSLKQLKILLILKLKQMKSLFYNEIYSRLYIDYICKYKEFIDEYHIDDQRFQNNYNYLYQEVANSNQFKNHNKLKFIQFFNLLDLFNIRIRDKQSIINDCSNGTLVWNGVLFELAIVVKKELNPIVINDRSIIDWFSNCKNQEILSFLQFNFHNFTFGTLQLANYVYHNSGFLRKLGNFNNSMIYSSVWFQAIRQSDSNTLKYIESLNLSIPDFKYFKTASTTTRDQIIKLINYINQTVYNKFTSENFKSFFNLLINEFNLNTGQYSEYDSIPYLNFNIPQVIPILIESISSLNLNWFKILLKSHLFGNDEFLLLGYEVPRYLFNKQSKVKYCMENQDSIIEIIKLIIKTKYRSTTDYSKDGNDIRSMMVNLFFEVLISIKGISMNQVKEVYQFIENSSTIKIKHDLYHSFWYLNIKSVKFTYLISSPYLYLNHFQLELVNEYFDCTNNNNDDNNNYQFLNPNEFTLESIDRLPFDTILEMLDDQLYSKFLYNTSVNTSNFRNNLNLQLNRDLEFYLIIKRVDLFFKKLDKIKMMLDYNNYSLLSESPFGIGLCLLDSPSTNLIESNTDDIKVNEYQPPNNIDPKLFEKFKKFEFPTEMVVNYFKFSKELVISICKVLDIDEIKRIIKFNYYISTSILNDLLYQSIYSGRFDIIKLLFNNFNNFKFSNIPMVQYDYNNSSESPTYLSIESISFIFENYFKLIQYPCKFSLVKLDNQFNYLKNRFIQLFAVVLTKKGDVNYDQFISPSTSNETKMMILYKIYLYYFKIIKAYNLEMSINASFYLYYNGNDIFKFKRLVEIIEKDEYQQLFKNFFNQQQSFKLFNPHKIINNICYNCNYNEANDNIFLDAFIKGDIKLCELILVYYPNYNFKITNQSITNTINNNNTHIIIHFLKYHINLFSNKLSLIDYFKSKIIK